MSDGGITHFDTAPYYGYGLAECDLGKFSRGHRARFTLATKIGLYPNGPASGHAMSVWCRKGLGRLSSRISLPVVNWQVARADESLRASLKRLGSDYVDFLFLHEPDVALLNTDEMLTWLQRIQNKGNVRAWGVAGAKDRITPLVLAGHPLAAVIQTQDSLDQRQADFLLGVGRSLQFTYGYLSGARIGNQVSSPVAIIREALRRNATGSVLISTRRVEHMEQLAKLIQ